MQTQRIEYVPIDFIKAVVRGMTPEDFSDNPLFSKPKSIFNGELLSKTIYEYKNLSIKVFENNHRIEFSGSLHTFYNNGEHNYNDFGKRQFNEALERLSRTLNIQPENLYLLHLEWGYNIVPPKETDYILDRLVQHKSVNRTVGMDCSEGKYTQFKHSTLTLKIYNKGKQFQLNDEVLRMEIKQTNWSKYRLQGVVTLQDFIDCDKRQFFDELLKQWERVVFYDIDHSKTEPHYQYQTSTFWDETRRTKSNKSVKYHFDKLKRLNETKGFNTQNQIIEILIAKGNELQI